MRITSAALSAVILLTLGVTSTTTAAETGTATAATRTGWSISLGVGASTIKDTDGDDEFDGSSVGFAAEVDYRFTPNFALGIGGFSLGSDNDMFGGEDTEITVRGFDLFGRLVFPLSDSTEIFGRLSGTTYSADLDPGGGDFGDALGLGFGIDFARREKAAVRVEYRYYNGGSDETGSLLMLGLNYLF